MDVPSLKLEHQSPAGSRLAASVSVLEPQTSRNESNGPREGVRLWQRLPAHRYDLVARSSSTRTESRSRMTLHHRPPEVLCHI